MIFNFISELQTSFHQVASEKKMWSTITIWSAGEAPMSWRTRRSVLCSAHRGRKQKKRDYMEMTVPSFGHFMHTVAYWMITGIRGDAFSKPNETHLKMTRNPPEELCLEIATVVLLLREYFSRTTFSPEFLHYIVSVRNLSGRWRLCGTKFKHSAFGMLSLD